MTATRPTSPLLRFALAHLIGCGLLLRGPVHAVDLQALVDGAVKRGDAQVVIPPGTYRLGPGEENGGLTIHDARNLIIVADGVTLLNTVLSRTITFGHCQNVTLRGLTVDYDPLPFTQGAVTKIAPDFSSIDVELDDGYPRQPYDRIDLCDPQTRHRKRGMPFLWNIRCAMVDERTVRVTLPGIGKAARIGDLASLSTGPASGKPPHAICVENCAGMTFDSVAVFSAPGFGIIESDGEGGMTYRHCRVVPGPKPPGATQERLLSTSWDALQTKLTRRGPLVEDCEIRSAGDDSWSVQSSDYVIVAVNGPKAVLVYRDPYTSGLEPGNRLARSLDSVKPAIVALKPVNLAHADLSAEIRAKLKSRSEFWSLSGRAEEITVAGAFPFTAGESVFCPDRQCNGFVFRNNRVQSPGRLLVKGGDGVIEDNEIKDCHAGVTVCPELPGEAASGMANLVIRHNRFSGTATSARFGRRRRRAASPSRRMASTII